MPDGTTLPSLADFVLATKPHSVSPSRNVLNDTAARYYFLGEMTKGKADSEVIQDGSEIISFIQTDKANTGAFYNPNQTLQPQGLNLLKKVKVPWKFHMSNFAWTNEEVELNGHAAEDTYVRLTDLWRRAARQEIWDNFEAALWATPSATTMVNGSQPYSIPTFITDDGLAPAGFSDVMGLDPATTPNWRNQVETYSAAARSQQLFPAFDRMWRKMRWEAPASKEEWTKNTNFSKMKIATDLNGLNAYGDLIRANNDRLSDPGQYVADPQYMNIALKEVPALTDQALTYSPYYWINCEFLHPVWHARKYMIEEDPLRANNQPFSWVVYYNTYMNLLITSRRQGGGKIVGGA